MRSRHLQSSTTVLYLNIFLKDEMALTQAAVNACHLAVDRQATILETGLGNRTIKRTNCKERITKIYRRNQKRV